MLSVTIKMDSSLAQEMARAMKPGYATKTEFIREAIRDKLDHIQKDRALAAAAKNFGKAKTKTTDEDLRRIREQVGREWIKRYGL